MSNDIVLLAGDARQKQSKLLSGTLSLPLMVWVGLLSYSLYLWHWPVLAYMRYLYGQYALPRMWLMVAVPLILVLAMLSYRYVELPARRLTLSFSTTCVALFLLPAAALVGSTYFAGKHRAMDAYPAELISYGKDVCHGNVDRNCIRGAPDVPPRVLVTGDSHAAALNHFIDVVGKHEGWSARVFTASSCAPVFGFDEKVLASWAHEPCNALKKYLVDNYTRYAGVILASQWAYQLGMAGEGSDPLYVEKLEHTLRGISADVPVYVVSDVPSLAVSPFRTLRFSEVGQIMNRPLPDDYLRANRVIRELAERIPNVHYVDLSEAWRGFSPQGIYEGKAAYFDGHHLNIYGSTALGRLFVETAHRVIPIESRPIASAR